MIFDCAGGVKAGFLFQAGRMAAGLVIPAALLVILGLVCVFQYLKLVWKERRKQP